jgi:DNA helicase-2/ATP-dependent DNA helicase PcrA
MSAAYLDKLNPDVEHGICERGVCDSATDAALLVIAGAGSGKTSTLAHRVVHLAANASIPASCLTFSRRAASR